MARQLSLALNEAMTLNQIAAKEFESGDDGFLKERREGLESINNDRLSSRAMMLLKT